MAKAAPLTDMYEHKFDLENKLARGDLPFMDEIYVEPEPDEMPEREDFWEILAEEERIAERAAYEDH